jgi:prepilin-type N-terminal cleavage/methylation domain-containing protein
MRRLGEVRRGSVGTPGFTLIEVMIVSAMIGISSLVMAELFSQQFKSSRSLELRASARDLADDIVSILARTASCQATFGGLDPNGPTSVDQIRVDPDGIPGGTANLIVRYQTGQRYGAPGVTLSSITLRTDPSQSVPVLAATQQGAALVTLNFSLGGTGQVTSGSTYTITRRIQVATAVSNPVTLEICGTDLGGSSSGQVPLGGIVIWSGAVVPSGWALCDGGTVNGLITPDLRGRFILGGHSYSSANWREAITGSSTSTGGAKDAVLVAHDHGGSVNTSTTGNHVHPFVPISSGRDGDNSANAKGVIAGQNFSTLPNGFRSDRQVMAQAGDHAHSLVIGSAGVSASNANLPPYYVLAFIMRIQ